MLKRIFGVILLFVFVLLAVRERGGPSPGIRTISVAEFPRPGMIPIAVRVTSRATGKPPASARVFVETFEEPVHPAAGTLVLHELRPTVAGFSGEIPTVASGFCPRILVTAPGHQRIELPWIADCRSSIDLDLEMAPGTTFVGRVTDTQGRPVEGAKVEFYQLGKGPYRCAPRLNVAPGPIVSDREGRFSAEHCRIPEPGDRLRIAVRVSHPAYRSRSRSIDLDSDDPRQIVELSFRLEPGVTIRGRVVDESGGGVPRAEVKLTPARSSDGWSGTARESFTENDGSFEVAHLDPAAYRLAVRNLAHLPLEIEVDRSGEERDLGELSLVPGHVLAGSVRTRAGAPVAGVSVWAGGRLVETDSQGAFRLGGFPPGTVDFHLAGTRHTTELPGDPVGVVLPRSRAVHVKLTDRDGRPVESGAAVLRRPGTEFAPQRAGDVLVFEVFTADSRSGCRGSTGVYQVVPHVTGYESRPTSICVTDEDEGPLEVTVRLDRGRTFDGKVFGADGEPLPDARIRMVLADHAGTTMVHGETQEDGSFAIAGIQDDRRIFFSRYRILVTADGHAPLVVMHTIPWLLPFGNHRDFHLSRGGTVEGTLRDDRGEPVVGRHVTIEMDPRVGLDFVPSTFSRGDGTFMLAHVPEGTWMLTLGSGAHRKTVQVIEGGTALVDWRLPD